MKKTLLLTIIISIFSFTACSDGIDDGANNKTDIAVTGNVRETYVTGVSVMGYANLNLIPNGTEDGYIIGVICSTEPEPNIDNCISKSTTNAMVGNEFSTTLYNLAPNTKYYYRTYVYVGNLYHYGKVKDFTTKDIGSSLITGDACDISMFGAKLAGSAKKETLGLADKYRIGIVCSTTPNPEYSNSNFFYSDISDGDFQTMVTNLSKDTKYYYRVCICYDYEHYTYNRYIYGETRSFTTAKTFSQAELSTNDARNITITGAKLFGTADTYALGINNYSLGFVYSTQRESDKSSWSKVSATQESRNASAEISNLSATTTYYYCIYVKNGLTGDYYYGDVKSFSTLSITDKAITCVTNSYGCFTANISMTLNWEEIGKLNNYSLSMLYSTNSNPTIENCKENEERFDFWYWNSSDRCSDNTHIVNISPLSNSTKYYYSPLLTYNLENGSKAYIYGKIYSITTRPFSPQYAGVDMGDYGIWAGCDLGAENPEEIGEFYAWGETTPKDSYTKENYNPTNIDAASANWGNGWRMPTLGEILRSITQYETTYKGVDGIMWKASNGNRIFFPKKNDYWTSTYFNSTEHRDWWYGGSGACSNYYGLRIRPIKK